MIFQIPSFITLLNPKILGFLFTLYEKYPNPVSEMWKIKCWMLLTRSVKNNNRSNCSTLSCTFPCHWFAWLQHETSRKLPSFHFLWRKCGICSCSLFPLLLIFFSSAIKFVSVRWSYGKLDLFKNYKRFNIIFPIDWLRSNSTIPPIAIAALLHERGR